MAITDGAVNLSDFNAAFARYERLHPTKAQFIRTGETSKWFMPRGELIRGKTYFYRLMTTPSTSARWNGVTAAAAAAFPAGDKMGYQEMSVAFTDLCMLQKSIRLNDIESLRSQNSQYSVLDIVKEAVSQAEMEFADLGNQAIHGTATGALATIAAIYDSDMTSFTEGAYANAYIKITDGALGQFLPGMILEIRDSSTPTTVNAIVQVKDVITSENGPMVAGVQTTGSGPGIIVAKVSDVYGTASTANWNTGGNTAAVADILVRYQEYAASTFKNPYGLQDFFDPTVNVFKDGDGNAINRDADGHRYLLPNIFVPSGASAGSEVAFSMDDHFGEVEDTLPFRVKTGRTNRAAKMDTEATMALPKTLAAIMPPDIANWVVREAKDSQRFTATLAMNLDDAKRKELFGVVGFDGAVYHSATLPPIAIQADPAAQPHRVRLIDPQSFFRLSAGDVDSKITWLDQGTGQGKWARLEDATTQTPTFYTQAGAYTLTYLGCDQIGVNSEIKHVKSGRK